MVIYFGADHRGFKLKEHLKKIIQAKGYEAMDCGNAVYDEHDDYPDFARAVAERVGENPGDRGIVICGSGAGMEIAANKFPRVRAATGLSSKHVYVIRHDDDVNVLAIGADFTTASNAEKMISVFLETEFDGGERYKRRIGKIEEMHKDLEK